MTTQPTTAAPPVTLEEYAALPKHPRYELVKGVLVEQMVASDKHEETVILTGIGVGNHVYTNRLGKVYGSNRGYVTGPDSPATSRMPDLSFVSNGRLDQPELAGMLYNGAPDLAVEILSDSNTPAEIAQKIDEYLSAGGSAVWVIDIDARILTVHTPGAPSLILTDADAVDGSDYLPGFACPVPTCCRPASTRPARPGDPALSHRAVRLLP